MNYQESNHSKKFFQDQWRHPLGRVRKLVVPVLASMTAVFGILSFFVGAMSVITGGQNVYIPLIFLVAAVCFGGAMAIFGHVFRFHKASQFQLIKVKIHPPARHHD